MAMLRCEICGNRDAPVMQQLAPTAREVTRDRNGQALSVRYFVHSDGLTKVRPAPVLHAVPRTQAVASTPNTPGVTPPLPPLTATHRRFQLRLNESILSLQ